MAWPVLLNISRFSVFLFHIDFLNFGAAGAASLIQEYRIYNQGTPLVEILDYNLALKHG